MVSRVLIWLGLSCFVLGAQSLDSSCQDLDTHACQLLQKSQPDICQSSAIAQGACQRFCGNCPVKCYSCPFPSTDATECNDTMTCGPKMRCMSKQFTGKDGHHEYIFSCERYEICDGLTIGFGRRDLDDIIGIDSNERHRYERDVYVSCCNSDFCNRPNQTTTTAPPTTTSTLTTTTSIPTTSSSGNTNKDCYRDVVFVIDDSVSVGLSNFKHTLDFVRSLVSIMNVGPSNAQIAVMTYSTHTKIEWYLNKYSNQSAVQNGLNHVTYNNGLTYTGAALKAVRTEILTPHHGDRLHADNTVIVMTDGDTNDKNEILPQAQALHAVAKDVIGIIIGRDSDIKQMNHIATDSNHVFDIHGLHHTHRVIGRVAELICG